MAITLDVTEIKKILPHRFPMLLVDRILDLELCSLIDTAFVPQLSKSKEHPSIYQIPYVRRVDLFNHLRQNLWQDQKKFATEDQLKRCLGLGYKQS